MSWTRDFMVGCVIRLDAVYSSEQEGLHVSTAISKCQAADKKGHGCMDGVEVKKQRGAQLRPLAPEARAEQVVFQTNDEPRELPQFAQAVSHICDASIALAGGRQSPPLPVESAVEGVEGVGVDIGRNSSLQASAWGMGFTENRDPRLGSPERGLWCKVI